MPRKGDVQDDQIERLLKRLQDTSTPEIDHKLRWRVLADFRTVSQRRMKLSSIAGPRRLKLPLALSAGLVSVLSSVALLVSTANQQLAVEQVYLDYMLWQPLGF